MGDRLKVRFGFPEHRWLPVWVEFGDSAFSEMASAVLNDFPDELVIALELVLRGDRPAMTAILWWEPGSVVFTFEAHRFTLVEHRKLDYFEVQRGGDEGELLLEAEVDIARVARRFYTALHQLEQLALSHPEEWKTHWRHPFPVERLRKLHELIRA